MDIQFMDKRAYYLIILVLLIIVTLVSWKIKNSKTGYYLAAINTNQNAASSLGVNVQRFKLKAMFISAFLTAIGGGFYASLIQFIDPERLLGYTLSVEIMTLAVVGGRGTLFGPIVGAFIMVPISEFLRSYLGTSLSGISNIMYGLILMSIVFFMPGGLATMFKKIGDKLFKSKKHSKEEVSQNV
jgi:branched-chain amino acid transport system permease protein